MVGTRLKMFLRSLENCCFVTVNHHGIAQAIGASPHKVFVGEAQSSPRIPIVVETGVELEVVVSTGEELLTRVAKYYETEELNQDAKHPTNGVLLPWTVNTSA